MEQKISLVSAYYAVSTSNLSERNAMSNFIQSTNILKYMYTHAFKI